ncbi:lipocalin-like domain-containing protein [Nonlabens antarcticus]|uniref:lipocalin family protein n=1 Tax=Nonlabens antarcticus TaxID=392714 RepID=UPI001891C7F5|nr:lipocalin family protein [Nonlabens antarcticus]
MKYLWIIIIALITTSCSDQSTDVKLENLKGYWNIERVEKPDGEEKIFPFTNHMDFFEVNENGGTKSRVSPTFDGRFVSYGETVRFVWEMRENQLILIFEEGDKSYTQILKEATKEELILVHENGTVYYYQPYEPNEKQ